MKKKLVIISAFLLSISLASSFVAGAFISGDINDDGIVSAKDAATFRKYLIGKKELGCSEEAADLNSDGKINVVDLILETELLLDSGIAVEVGTPVFSMESGFYASNMELALSAGDGAKIYYTTDGSQPDTSSQLYNGKIHISDRSSEKNNYSNIKGISNEDFTPETVTKGTVVKAIAVDSQGNISKTVSQTYFCGIDINSKYNGFPVICMTVDTDDMFGYEKGIYVRGKVYDDWVAGGGNPYGQNTWEFPGNYTQTGEEWERKVYLELFENDGKLAFSQDMGTRITGNASRANNQKSFKFYARDKYGKKNIKYKLIPDAKTEIDDTTVREKYKRFTLRSGANDAQFAKFRDNYIQSLVGDRAFETQSSRPAILFLNGEYWGVYCLQEDYSDSYIENNYNIPEDNVVIISCGYEVDDGVEDDINLYNDLLNFASSNDLSVTQNYNKISGMMDMQSFIDYYCCEIFIANQDWINNNNNYRIWRSRTVTDQPYEDGKWRWMMYDTEYSLSLYGGMMGGTYTYDTMADALYGAQNTSQIKENAKLFNQLMKNNEFKQCFVSTFCDLMNENLSKGNMLSVLDNFEKMYEPVMTDQVRRFGPSWSGSVAGGDNPWSGGDMPWGGGNIFNPDINTVAAQQPGSELSTFKSEISNIRTFINQREPYIYQMFTKHLGLSGKTAQVSVQVNNANGGTVTINTVTPELKDNKWIGKYCTEYPVTITANANEGYKFTGWTGVTAGASDRTISVPVTGDISVTANFTRN